jgi:sugar phosphate isomerase/epimerase
MFPGVSTQIFARERLGGTHAEAVRAAGFEAVEVYSFPSHFDISDAAHTREAAAVFRDNGVRIHSLHAPFFDTRSKNNRRGWLSISHTDENMRRVSLDKVRECIACAAELGAGIITIHFGGTSDRNTSGVLSSLFSSLVQIEDDLQGTNIRAAFENIATPVSLCGYMRHFIEKYGFRACGICLDIGHANINEDPASAVERAGDMLLNVHASDNTGHGDAHDPPFMGSVRWDRVGRALLDSGYSGSFTFEPRTQAEPKAFLNMLMESYSRILALAAEEDEQDTPGSI